MARSSRDQCNKIWLFIAFLCAAAVGIPCLIAYIDSPCDKARSECNKGRTELFCQVCEIHQTNNCTVAITPTRCDSCQICTDAERDCNEASGIALLFFGAVGVTLAGFLLIVLLFCCD